ncbi:thiol-activated cytolysin family protein [Porphyromonas pogonae]|uniref:thiol-activated cytolysin family protein n=1 Tax=Porphyromonas pogonae TaxID=867595 RepID=UPI002E790BB8|nr:thiol-activated cytolysin family protein [Porphyromonas pogonae]
MKVYKSKLAVSTLILLSIVGCNANDTLTTDVQNDEINSKKEMYDGQPTEVVSQSTYSSLPSFLSGSDNTDSPCKDVETVQSKIYQDFSKFDRGTNLMWPGNLVQGESIRTGELASIPVDGAGRNSIEVKVDAFSLNATKPTSYVIPDPTPGKVQDALGKALDSYYSSETRFPANYTIDIQRAFNSKQLQLALNVGFSGFGKLNVGASLGIDFKQSKTYYAVTLKQKFFTVSVSPKAGLKGDNGWIKSNYPDKDISAYISEHNPPVYVSTVTYGRLYALVYESDENSLDLEQALNFAYKNPTTSVTVDQKLKYSNTLRNSKVYVKQLGGNATDGLLSSFSSQTGDFEKVREFVIKGAEVSKSNPGYPIEYTAANIKNNKPVTVKYEEKFKHTECRNIPYTANSESDAKREVNKLKAEYGTGNCAKIIINNKTDQNISLASETVWCGSTFYSSVPTIIASGKSGYALAIHKQGVALGTFNQLSYKLGEQIVSFGTYAPWNQFRTNNVLVDFKQITEQELYNNSTRPANEKNKNNIIIKGKIDLGDSPLVVFNVQKS